MLTVAWNRNLPAQRYIKYILRTRGQETTELSQSLWDNIPLYPLWRECQIPADRSSGPIFPVTRLSFLPTEQSHCQSIFPPNQNGKQSVMNQSIYLFLRMVKRTLSCRCCWLYACCTSPCNRYTLHPSLPFSLDADHWKLPVFVIYVSCPLVVLLMISFSCHAFQYTSAITNWCKKNWIQCIV